MLFARTGCIQNRRCGYWMGSNNNRAITQSNITHQAAARHCPCYMTVARQTASQAVGHVHDNTVVASRHLEYVMPLACMLRDAHQGLMIAPEHACTHADCVRSIHALALPRRL